MTKTNWKVTRFCCTSGMCIQCRAVATGRKRIRVTQIDKLTKDRAEKIAENWHEYDGKAERE